MCVERVCEGGGEGVYGERACVGRGEGVCGERGGCVRGGRVYISQR